MPSTVPRLGLIADTHNFLDPVILDLFAGVTCILHAGDIGQPRVIAELERVAPVTAVGACKDFTLRRYGTEVDPLTEMVPVASSTSMPTSEYSIPSPSGR